MKVMFVLHTNDPYGGSTKSFLNMLRGLILMGVESTVVLSSRGGIQCLLEEWGVPTIVLNYRPNLYPYDSTLLDYLLWLPRLIARRFLNAKAASALAKELSGFDLVHTNVSVIDIGVRAARKKGIPHLFHFREYGDLDFGYKYYPNKKRYLSQVDYSVCITKGIQKHHGLNAEGKSWVVYNPITPDNAQLPVVVKEDYILYAGRLQKTKGIEDLLEAYCKSECRFKLYIAGSALDDRFEKRIRQYVFDHGKLDQVCFLGERGDIGTLMQKARAVVVPSYNEAFGRVAAEAMLNGTLVIGRNTGGMKEQFDNGVEYTGKPIGLAFNNVKELTGILSSFESAETDIAERAFRTVMHYYSENECVERMFEIYKKIIKNKVQRHTIS